MALHSDSRRLGSLEGRCRLMTKAETKARRTQKRNGYKGVQVRKDKRLAIYLRDGFKCTYCGCDLHGTPPFNVTLDHVNPHVKGGTNATDNLVTACRACNCGRQDRPLTPPELTRVFRATNKILKPYRDLAKAILRGECGGPPTERDIFSEECLSTRPNDCGYPSCSLPWCSWCPAQLQQ